MSASFKIFYDSQPLLNYSILEEYKKFSYVPRYLTRSSNNSYTSSVFKRPSKSLIYFSL